MNILFFGTPDFSVPTLRRLIAQPGVRVGAVVTQPDRPAGRGGKISYSPIKQVATEHGIPVIQPQSLRKELLQVQEQLAAVGPFDVGVVIAFGQILPKEILDLPHHGCINIHASLLPRWRGAAPIQRALEAGDAETGVCLMQMDVGLDTGAVFCEARTAIDREDTGETLHDRLSLLGAELLTSKLSQIASGQIAATPQPADGVTYATKITTEECRIDWARPASALALTIRAFAPYPGCFSFWRGKRLKILFGRPGSSRGAAAAAPGTVVYASHGRLEVQCGDAPLVVESLQLEGKKRMATEEFLRGTGLSVGEVLLAHPNQQS